MNSSDIAISISGLEKVYRLYENPLSPLIEKITGRKRHSECLALDNIDLILKRGEIVGILGRNGAGKSTLLRIIAGTLEPTRGRKIVNGRLTAILELGTGFHPEYTGRENIYMGGLCLGMSRREIDDKIDQIIEFSELVDVIDHPFKTYSSGMQARLTFSTAISVDPDILIIDEALSVGDARFQLKCFNWMQSLRKKNATILVVSHDTNTITSICDRAVILENGKVYAEGETRKISEMYQNILFGRNDNTENYGMSPVARNVESGISDLKDKTSNNSESISSRYGTGEAVLTAWRICDEKGIDFSYVESGAPFTMKMEILCKQDIADLSCGFAIKDRRGTVLWGMTNMTSIKSPFSLSSGEKIQVLVTGTMWLAAGEYFITLGLAHAESGEKIDFIENAIGFKVIGADDIFTTSIVNLQSKLEIIRINTNENL